MTRTRVGIDLGGTKIAGIAMSASGEVIRTTRTDTPRNDYAATIGAIARMVADLSAGEPCHVGVGMPGSVSRLTGRVQNANSTWINGRHLQDDLEAALDQPVRLANDANCLALSEAHDGAAAGAASVFGVIAGTGCGGAMVIDGKLVEGRHAISGEWGHNPLPWPSPDEYPGPACWCGRHGCLETWVSGPALASDHASVTGPILTSEQIAAAASIGDADANATLDRHLSRMARGLAHVINLLDPHVIVIGGGLVQLPGLVSRLPGAIAPYVFADAVDITVKAAQHGPESGVRGAARLWDDATSARIQP